MAEHQELKNLLKQMARYHAKIVRDNILMIEKRDEAIAYCIANSIEDFETPFGTFNKTTMASTLGKNPDRATLVSEFPNLQLDQFTILANGDFCNGNHSEGHVCEKRKSPQEIIAMVDALQNYTPEEKARIKVLMDLNPGVEKTKVMAKKPDEENEPEGWPDDE